ncbi:MAG: tRNA (adenosine(37)-N6)-threonylcarbamoyltransferase complex ATPase subunit type 1 TsaE [Cryobacterium sp.]|nr:tRNA (adenosine(37)-N6)-threonylcarbamoyltransferase complex ATPase subunit type 1 TsaE [Cryobacterium sp.]
MERLGASIAAQLDAGDLLALNGELGAGKTTFVRGLGEALGTRGGIASPTFVIARTHPTERGVPLVHVDAYRLSSAAELDDLDLDFEGSIVAVEWAAGMLDGVADAWLEISIERPRGAGSGADRDLDAEEARTVTITGHGDRWSQFRL